MNKGGEMDSDMFGAYEEILGDKFLFCDTAFVQRAYFRSGALS